MNRHTSLPAVRATVALALGLILTGPALGQDPRTEFGLPGSREQVRANNTGVINDMPTSGVVDKAGLFSPDAVKRAISELERLEKTYHVATLVETVDSLRGVPIKEAAVKKATGTHGLYLLISKQEHSFETVVAPAYRAAFPTTARARLGDALVNRFKQKDFDGGLTNAVAAIGEALEKAKAEHKLPAPGASGSSALVVQNQTRLTLAGARLIIEGAEAKATALGLKQNLAVVDDGGHLIGFSRMDGARPASIYTAMTKAASAATFRQATGPMSKGGDTDVHLSLSLQNAAAASGGRMTTLPGGIPILVDGQVIGAIGVAGATGEQDVEVAKAGVAKFLESMGGTKSGERE